MRKILASSLSLALLLVACGGGGGSGNTTAVNNSSSASSSSISSSSAASSSPSSTAASMSLSNYKLGFTAQEGYPAGYTTVVMALQNFVPVTAVLSQPDGSAIPAWLSITLSETDLSARFEASGAGMTAGTYSTTVRIKITNTKGESLYKDLAITLEVYSAAPSSVKWNVYSGSVIPDASNSILLADNSSASFTRTGATTGTTSVSSGIATFDTTMNSASDNVQYKYDLPYSSQYPKTLTFIARVKAESVADALRALSVEANFADTATTPISQSARVKLAIYGNQGSTNNLWQGFTMEQCDAGTTTWGVCNSPSGLLTVTDFHVYHVSVTLTEPTKGYLRVYVDNYSSPIVSYGSSAAPKTFRTAAEDGASYIRFGDMNSQVHKSYIDWLIWTQQGAYSPSELVGKLPNNIGIIPAIYQQP